MALTRLNTNAYGSTINLTSNVTGTLPSANGGTGATSFNSAGLVLISNTTVASAGTLDINDLFSSSYVNYRVIGSGLNQATDNTAWVFQLRTDSAVTNTSYWWAGVGQRDGGSAVDDGETDVSDWRIMGNNANTGQALNFDMVIYKPQVSGHYTSYTCTAGGRRSGGGGQDLVCGGYQNTTTQFTGLRFLCDSGNVSAGNILVFGIRDS
tara:strand:+ start:735 stop:1361 length:627 start_codon:yes stop_codon:yes gene_type:complete